MDLDQLKVYRPRVPEPGAFDDFWTSTLLEAGSIRFGPDFRQDRRGDAGVRHLRPDVLRIRRHCPPSTVYAAYNAYGEGTDALPEKSVTVYTRNDHERGGDYQTRVRLYWFTKPFTR